MTDAVLVRAPVGAVYLTLTDLDGWPRWLDGCRSERAHAAEDAADVVDRHRLVLPLGRRRWRIDVAVRAWRHDEGVHWDVSGAVALRSEWWLEQRPEGTVVHHVVHGAAAGRRQLRHVRDHRRAIMLALQAMKDHLELAVAVASGRVP